MARVEGGDHGQGAVRPRMPQHRSRLQRARVALMPRGLLQSDRKAKTVRYWKEGEKHSVYIHLIGVLLGISAALTEAEGESLTSMLLAGAWLCDLSGATLWLLSFGSRLQQKHI